MPVSLFDFDCPRVAHDLSLYADGSTFSEQEVDVVDEWFQVKHDLHDPQPQDLASSAVSKPGRVEVSELASSPSSSSSSSTEEWVAEKQGASRLTQATSSSRAKQDKDMQKRLQAFREKKLAKGAGDKAAVPHGIPAKSSASALTSTSVASASALPLPPPSLTSPSPSSSSSL